MSGSYWVGPLLASLALGSLALATLALGVVFVYARISNLGLREAARVLLITLTGPPR